MFNSVLPDTATFAESGGDYPLMPKRSRSPAPSQKTKKRLRTSSPASSSSAAGSRSRPATVIVGTSEACKAHRVVSEAILRPGRDVAAPKLFRRKILVSHWSFGGVRV